MKVCGQVFPVRQGEKWGLINMQGQIVLPADYDFIDDYTRQGLAIARKNGKTGILNSKGEAIVGFDYEQARLLPQGVIVLWQNGRCGLFEATGKALTTMEFSKISPLDKNFLLSENGDKKGMLSPSGMVILPCEYQQIFALEKNAPFRKIQKNGLFGLLRLDGKLLVEPIYTAITVETSQAICQNGKAYDVIIFDEKFEIKTKENYLNRAALDLALKTRTEKAFKTALQRQNTRFKWLSEGFRFRLVSTATGQNALGDLEFYDVSVDEKSQKALARKVNTEKKDVCYYIDMNDGKLIFQATVKDILISDFNISDFAKCTVDTLWDALIDRQGQITTHLQGQKIKNIGLYSEKGFAWVQFSDNKFAFMDSKAKIFGEQRYAQAADFVCGYAIAKLADKFGAFSPAGGIPFVYDGIADCEDGLFRVKKGTGKEGKWGIVDTKNTVILPFEYDAILPFSGGFATIRKNGKSGLIDNKGRIIIPAILDVDFIGALSGGIAQTGKERTASGYRFYGFVDAKGNTVLPCQYQKIEGFESVWQAKKGIARVYQDNKIGFVNHTGQIIVEPLYSSIGNFEKIYAENKGIVRCTQNGKNGYLDHLGRNAIPCHYEEIENFERILTDSTVLVKAKHNGLWGYINAKGQVKVPFQYQELEEFRNGVACAQKNGFWGVINESGEDILPFLYASAKFLEDSPLIIVSKAQSSLLNINPQGQITQSPPPAPSKPQWPTSDKFQYVYYDGKCGIVKKENLFALTDNKGKTITKFEFLQIGPFSQGLAFFQDKSKKYGFINQEGKIIIPAQYARATELSEGKAAVGLTPTKWTYIKPDGSEAFKGFFRSAQPFFGGYAIVNGSEIINADGEKVGSFSCETEGKFSSQRAIAKDAEGFFHILPTGNPAYNQRYDEVTPFLGEIAFVRRGEVWELIRYSAQKGETDPSRVRETRLKFTRSEREAYLRENGNGKEFITPYGQITRDIGWRKISEGKWRMIDTDGNLVSDALFSSVKILENGWALAQCDYLYGIVDAKGQEILPVGYESIRVRNGLIKVEKQGMIGYLTLSGQWVWKLE